jgi:3-dehydroquinate dehydratase-2
MLGTREPEIYGSVSFDDFIGDLKKKFTQVELLYFQSNHEGAIIDKIQEMGLQNIPLIVNAGGYTHTSVAIADALRLVNSKKIEVHISNIFAREEYRKHSYISETCNGVISGLGLQGYELAIASILNG